LYGNRSQDFKWPRATGMGAALESGTDVNTTSTSATSARLRAVIEMVQSGSAFTSRDLAARIQVSPSRLRRLFKQETGMCMGEWLAEQRLQRAAHLLVNSYLSVKEITHSVGYEHPSSFIRAFERRFTQAPSSYRARGFERPQLDANEHHGGQ
jgi:transcriptional regulator GlxA family with amidase domain